MNIFEARDSLFLVTTQACTGINKPTVGIMIKVSVLMAIPGARIEIASFSEWLANSKEIASFSEWLANRITLRTKIGARIEIASFSEWLANREKKQKKRCSQRLAREWRSRAFQNCSRVEIASFSEWLANRKRCAQRKGARMDIASFSEWLSSRNRELFRMARE